MNDRLKSMLSRFFIARRFGLSLQDTEKLYDASAQL